jgi:ABC-type transport system substrate-binding protein
MSKLGFPIVVLGVVLLLAISCGGGAEPAPVSTVAPTATSAPTTVVATPTPTATPIPAVKEVRGGVLKLSQSYPPTHFDCAQEFLASCRAVWGYMSDGLVGMDTRPGKAKVDEAVLDASFGLAESWELSDGGKTYVFHLRPGMKWQNIAPMNGREFVADDVVWNLQRRKGPRAGWQLIGHFDSMTSVKAIDKYTVEIKLEAPLAPFVTYLAWVGNFMNPKEAALLEDPSTEWGSHKRKESAIGVGPYVLKEFVRDGHMIWERHPDYWNPKYPFLDRIDRPIIIDGQTRIAAFKTKQLDIMDYTNVQAAQSRALVKELTPLGALTSGVAQSVGWHWLAPNSAVKPFDDKRVRQAFRLIMDRRDFNLTEYQGTGELWKPLPNGFGHWSHPQPEKLFGWEVDDATVAANRAKAKELLAAAGLTGPQKFEFMINARYKANQNQLQVYQQQFRTLGIELVMKIVETAVWFERVGTHDFVLSAGTSSVGGAGVDPDEYLSNWWLIGAGRNYGNWGDELSDKMIRAARFESNTKKREALLWEWQEYVAEQAWAWPQVGSESTPQLFWPWVKDYQAHSLQQNDYTFRHTWIDPKLR